MPNNKIKTITDARQYAERYIEQGVGMLAHALNACYDNKIPYRFGEAEQERLKNIVLELMAIVEGGKVELINNNDQVLEYKFCSWGDLIYGTKDQLQALGIGIGLLFPSENGQIKQKSIMTEDPRGFKTRISLSTYMGEGIYNASISFPDRQRYYSTGIRHPYADNVTISHDTQGSVYIGTEEGLANAGLVDATKLPGKPGMRKSTVTIYPDFADHAGNVIKVNKRTHGTKIIKRVGIDRYELTVITSKEEQKIRWKKFHDEGKAWELKVNALPRPAKLTHENVKSYINEQNEIKNKKIKSNKKFQAFLSNIQVQ